MYTSNNHSGFEARIWGTAKFFTFQITNTDRTGVRTSKRCSDGHPILSRFAPQQQLPSQDSLKKSPNFSKKNSRTSIRHRVQHRLAIFFLHPDGLDCHLSPQVSGDCGSGGNPQRLVLKFGLQIWGWVKTYHYYIWGNNYPFTIYQLYLYTIRVPGF